MTTTPHGFTHFFIPLLELMNIGRVVPVSNETNTGVCMYISSIYSSRYLDTLLYKVELKMYRKCSSMHTYTTIEEKG